MRAVLTLPISPELDVVELREALAPTTWLPSADPDEPWMKARVDALVQEFPESLRVQLQQAGVIYIQVGLTVEGLVSLERHGAVMIRLVHDGNDVSAIKAAVHTLARHLPDALKAATGNDDLGLETDIEIRQRHGGIAVAKGEIITPHRLRFPKYVRTERPREFALVCVLAGLLAATFVTSLWLAHLHPISLSWPDVIRGHGERISSALVVALLTILINLLFEYRDWRSETTEVRWLFG
ncbi:hypothetical protein [Mycobacterium kyogaense]|uniref:hypothetical protein n=1 Tax=Mycobacterium kyogaense TaxID=2212479 RepID=UPI000DAC5896|nr:hypothetical protein [Mycobacterium kyogaense]